MRTCMHAYIVLGFYMHGMDGSMAGSRGGVNRDNKLTYVEERARQVSQQGRSGQGAASSGRSSVTVDDVFIRPPRSPNLQQHPAWCLRRVSW